MAQVGESFEIREQKPEEKFNLKVELWEWMEAVVVSFVILIFIFAFFFRIIGISGTSMQTTLMDENKVIVMSMFYTPAAGDIVVINQPNEFGKPIIKRIIAMENQTVDIDFETGDVFVDGQKLDEPYISSPTTVSEGVAFPVTVPEGKVFVMGDNRQDSLDSRSQKIGMIDTRYILGKAVLRVFPLDSIGFIH